MKKLSKSFFQRDTLIVAKELLGKVIKYNGVSSIITEVEAYKGSEDAASRR